MKRRDLLAGVGVFSAGCLAGCSQLHGDRRLTGIRLLSFDRGPTRIDIEILRDGEQAHETTVELNRPDESGFAGTSIECGWSPDVAQWEVRARMEDGDEWVGVETEGFTTETCWLVHYSIRSGQMTITEESICPDDGDCWHEWTADTNSGEI